MPGGVHGGKGEGCVRGGGDVCFIQNRRKGTVEKEETGLAWQRAPFGIVKGSGVSLKQMWLLRHNRSFTFILS